MGTRTLVLVALLTPCLAYGGLRDKLGIKQNLKKLSPESLSIDPAPPLMACPGVPATFDVVATLSDGALASTANKVTWRSYDLSSSAGTVDSKGEIVLPASAKATWGQPVSLTATAPDFQGLITTGEVHPAYDCSFQGNFRGAAGPTGNYGAQGDAGDKSAKGQRGGTGGNGGRGLRGPDLEVWVALTEEPLQGKQVLKVKVHDRSSNTNRFFAVGPAGGSLVIDASGGAGGTGGPGGSGGSGGNGPANGPGGDGGDGGDGGAGGDGGDGGSITLTVSPAAEPFLDRITLVNRGGPGGAAGQQGYGGSGGIGYGGAPSGAKGTEGQPSVSPGQPGQPGPVPTIKTASIKVPW